MPYARNASWIRVVQGEFRRRIETAKIAHLYKSKTCRQGAMRLMHPSTL
jgi:hypothetical protein